MSKKNNLIGYSTVDYRFLLDEVPNAIRAHSVFRLDSSYAGSCIFASVTVADIGFVNNLIDTSAITAATDGVAIWYDQTLNADATTVAGRRPDIKTSGVIKTLNGIPAFNFNAAIKDYINGGGNIFRNTGYGFIAAVCNRITNVASEALIVSVGTSTPNTRASISYRNIVAGNQGLNAGGRRLAANSFQAVGTSAYSNNQIIVCAFFDWANAELTIWENNVMTGNLTPFQTAGLTENNAGTFAFGSNLNGTAGFLNGHIQEVVIWEGADAQNAAANVSTIFDNINSRFNTY